MNALGYGMEVLDLTDAIVFEKDVLLKRLIRATAGFFLCNSFKINVNNPYVKDVLLGDRITQTEIQHYLKEFMSEAMKKILVYGFVSYRSNPRNVLQIDCINYTDGRLYYKVNADCEIEFQWAWENQAWHGSFDKSVKHYTHISPSFRGEVQSTLAGFISLRKELDVLSGLALKVEKAKASPQFYFQKIFPNLHPERYEVMQSHNAMINKNWDDVDSDATKYANLHGINSGFEFYLSDVQKQTKENIGQYFQGKNSISHKETPYDVGVDTEKIRIIPTNGELLQTKFIPVYNSGSTYQKSLRYIKKNWSELWDSITLVWI